MEVHEEFALKMKEYFSITSLQSAAQLCRMAHDLEINNSNYEYDTIRIKHRTYVANSIISCVCCLESTVNELFIDILDETNTFIWGINDRKDWTKLNNKVYDDISEKWNDEGYERKEFIEKFICTSSILGEEITRDKEPVQSIKLLYRLRNQLIHSKPEWVYAYKSDGIKTIERIKIDRSLRGKFDLNPLTTNDFFPDAFMSYGCSEWACKSTISFIDYFANKIGLEPSYHHLRDTLSLS